MGAAIRSIQTFGLDAPGVVTRQAGGKLWEIKVDAQRVFYVVASGPVLWLLHAYRKASQKAPSVELTTARERMKEILR